MDSQKDEIMDYTAAFKRPERVLSLNRVYTVQDLLEEHYLRGSWGHELESEDNPLDRSLGFFDRTDGVLTQLPLTALRMFIEWTSPEGWTSSSGLTKPQVQEAMRSAEGRQKLFARPGSVA